MDLAVPAVVERASRAAREFVESYLLSAAESRRAAGGGAGALSDLAALVAESPLAHFAVFRELGRLPRPWDEIFRVAGLQFHAVWRTGGGDADAGLVALALGDPRRRPDREALGVRAAAHGDGWELQGTALLPGYLRSFDSLLAAARTTDRPDVGLFMVAGAPSAAPARDTALIRGVLDRTRGRLLARGEAAWQILLGLRRRERLSQIALALGAARRAHESSVGIARAAAAARDPLAAAPGVRLQLADDAIDLQMAETLGMHGAALADAGALTDAELASTRFMVLEAFERIARRSAHVAGLLAPRAPEWSAFVVDLARLLRLEGGAVELDRRDAAAALSPTA